MQLFDKTYTPVRDGDLVTIDDREYKDIVFNVRFDDSGYICFESIKCNTTVKLPIKCDIEVFENVELHISVNQDEDNGSLF